MGIPIANKPRYSISQQTGLRQRKTNKKPIHPFRASKTNCFTYQISLKKQKTI